YSTSPACVTLRLRVVLRRSRASTMDSSRAICLLTADFDTPSTRAAPEKLFVSTTRAKATMAAAWSCNLSAIWIVSIRKRRMSSEPIVSARSAINTCSQVSVQGRQPMKAIELQRFDRGGLQLVERAPPQPMAGEVLARVLAVSLNYRDVEILHGRYGMPVS